MKQYLKVVEVQDLISGTSNNGIDWEKQTVVFEKTGDGKRQLAIDFMGERRTRTTKKLRPGQLCEVAFEPNSRKFEDKWFTNLEGYSVTPLAAVVDDGKLVGAEPEDNGPYD